MKIVCLALVVAVGCVHADLRESLTSTPSTVASGSRIAMTVVDLSSGRRASSNGAVRLPMMSVFKLPLAVAALDAVDHGELSLSQPIPLTERELVPSVSPIAEAWHKGETAPTLAVLLTRMIQDSDNTAGDKMVSVLGGGERITARLRALGIEQIAIGEPEINISARLSCLGPTPTDGWTAAAVEACPKAARGEQVAAAKREIETAPNAATTDAIVELLRRLDHGDVLTKASRRWLLTTLAGTTTGAHRIKALLPPGTPVAHKTGTGGVDDLSIATNDVGIVTLPNGHRFAIAVFVTGSHAPLAEQEQTIARLARATWDVLSR